MKTNPKDNAFPMTIDGGSITEAHMGLTKRELFAAMIYACSPECTVDSAVKSADALIRRLNEDPQ